MPTKVYTRAFPRIPIDTIAYMASANDLLAHADTQMALDSATSIINCDWNIYNDLIYVTVFYTTSA